MRGEVLAHLPGWRGSPGGGNGAQNGAISTQETWNRPRIDPKQPGSDTNWPGFGPKKPGVGSGLVWGDVGRGFCAGKVLGDVLLE